MSKKAAASHKKAAEHHAHAATHHEAGDHEKAAHHAHTAKGHQTHATKHSEDAATHTPTSTGPSHVRSLRDALTSVSERSAFVIVAN